MSKKRIYFRRVLLPAASAVPVLPAPQVSDGFARNRGVTGPR